MSLPIEMYERLHQKYGDQSWWPGNSQIDVVVGAILTQAVSWRNVELAIRNMKDAKCIVGMATNVSAIIEDVSGHARPQHYMI